MTGTEKEQCSICRKFKSPRSFPKRHDVHPLYAGKLRYCTACSKKWFRDTYYETKKRILWLLGNECEACGGRDDLEVDHKAGGGSKERVELGGTLKVWQFYLRPENRSHISEYLQLLCHPCHKLKKACETDAVQKSKKFARLQKGAYCQMDAVLQWVRIERAKQLREIIELARLEDGVEITWDDSP